MKRPEIPEWMPNGYLYAWNCPSYLEKLIEWGADYPHAPHYRISDEKIADLFDEYSDAIERYVPEGVRIPWPAPHTLVERWKLNRAIVAYACDLRDDPDAYMLCDCEYCWP